MYNNFFTENRDIYKDWTHLQEVGDRGWRRWSTSCDSRHAAPTEHRSTARELLVQPRGRWKHDHAMIKSQSFLLICSNFNSSNIKLLTKKIWLLVYEYSFREKACWNLYSKCLFARKLPLNISTAHINSTWLPVQVSTYKCVLIYEARE